MDRIDLRVDVPAVQASDLIAAKAGESSAVVAERVARARAIQTERYAALGLEGTTNALANNSVIETIATPDDAGQKLLEQAAKALRFSARGYHRILKVSRTLADLDGAERVGRIHLAEAISYRAVSSKTSQAA